MRALRVGLLVAGIASGLACGPAASPRTPDAPKPAAPPPRFTPPPPLGEPTPGDPMAVGYDFLAQMMPALQGRWETFLDNLRLQFPPSHDLNKADLVVELAIAVSRSGAVREVSVSRSSGNREFDEVAIEVVRDAAPFAAPPPHLVSDDDLLHVWWAFARDVRQAGLSGARIERVEWDPSKAVPKLVAQGLFGEAASRIAKAAAATSSAVPDALLGLADRVAATIVEAALAASDTATQRAGAEAAGRAGAARWAKPVVAFARSGADATVRMTALRALGDIGGARAREAVAAVAASDAATDKERVEAVRVLAKLGAADSARPIAVGLLESKNAEHTGIALAMLAHVPAPLAIEPLTELFARGRPRPLRRSAAFALGRVAAEAGAPGTSAAKTLLGALKSKDGAVRAAAASALGEAAEHGYRSKLAYWEVIRLLKDRDERARAAGALAGAQLGGPRFAKDFHVLRRERSPMVLAALARALGSVPGASSASRLKTLVDSEFAPVRVAAAESLLKLGAVGAPILLGLRRAADPGVRIASLRAADDVAVVVEFLDDASLELRAAAVLRLAELRGRSGALEGAAKLMASSSPLAAQASVAGAWLATATGR